MSLNPSTAMATVLVDELVIAGVTDAVLSPGSRNAPLSFAFARAAAAGRLRLHVRIDERSAGFLALGLAKRSGRPVPVSCTSGTAAANLHPAVLEANHAGVPLMVLTADRPPELRDTGASQTIDQIHLYGTSVRYFHEFGVADRRDSQNGYWREQVCRAIHMATAATTTPGPVHLNIPFRDPLVPAQDPADDWPDSLVGRADGLPWARPPRLRHAEVGDPVVLPGRTLVVAGEAPDRYGQAAARFAAGYGLPLVSEPTGGAWGGSLAAGPWLLGEAGFLDRVAPDHVLVVGRPTLGRALSQLVRRSGVAVTAVEPDPRWPDPFHTASRIVLDLHDVQVVDPDPEWLPAWTLADKAAADAVADGLRGSWPSGGLVASALVSAMPAGSLLCCGSSNPVRDVDYFAPRRTDIDILSNRGVAGIDGNVSTAVGAALASDRPTFAMVGDLTFLHDSNGLVIGPDEPRPDLTIVVFNDNGGAIFSLLEQGEPAYADVFERVFGTPHGADLGALCAATRTPHLSVGSAAELTAAVRTPSRGLRVLEVAADRRGLRDLHKGIRAAVASALSGHPTD
ncbi:2-succinyl-5-enolpyruvyl-6-hydroxy-3-cyclohexene- 1-carboxylic-acid synthase [Fodinicola feengrottensis]|uniref:2-succinyl-5-enolpyruvyl-6-hydroxy-3-cyclohexene-1-carboxylate synthase n=1 Tax=Fodinicola feengrottensis TaxID=435914 RepID=A0ABN2FPX4_9ACTN